MIPAQRGTDWESIAMTEAPAEQIAPAASIDPSARVAPSHLSSSNDLDAVREFYERVLGLAATELPREAVSLTGRCRVARPFYGRLR
jgi:hypothetical protein